MRLEKSDSLYKENTAKTQPKEGDKLSYIPFTDEQKVLAKRFGIDDFTDFSTLKSEDYPIMSDLYELIEKEFMAFDHEKKHLYTEEILQNICLGLHSMCKGCGSQNISMTKPIYGTASLFVSE